MKEILTFFAWFGAIAAMIIALTFGGYFATAFFAPKYEAIRRDTMIESRAYSEATVRELYRLKRQYEAAQTMAEKQTIAAAALHEFEIFPEERLPVDLAAWLNTIKIQ